ncbi:MAG: amidohydrolase family protein [Armatimonadetes bacterium]|nr:amidohydrolase family protein [Armatimonadota bacterium]
MVIDVHHHLPAEWEPYVERLRAEAQRIGIDRVVVCTTGVPGQATNEQVAEAVRAHPDFLLGLGHLRLGEDSPREVEHIKSAGLHGLKLIRPRVRYDDDEAMEIYARAAAHKMPILFHLGIVARSGADAAMDVSIARMRPVYLDRIARRFPDLPLIGAHFGNPWYEEAAELARMHPNVYFDLTGSTLKKKKPDFFRELLWWADDPLYGRMGDKTPWQKILFGTDVGPDLMEDVMNDYQKLMDGLGLDDANRQLIWGGNAAQVFGIVQ